MNTGNPIKLRNENPNYVAYFYESSKVQSYFGSNKSLFAGSYNSIPATYDFSSDLIKGTRFHRVPTVEQIIANGYLSIPKSDPVEAIISDKKHMSWLGLDDVINQVRKRYQLYQTNMYGLELAKCAAMNSVHDHEAHHGPPDSRIEYSLNKRLDNLYKDQREERINLWRDISKLRLLLPENAQNYLAAYRKLSILEESKGDKQ